MPATTETTTSPLLSPVRIGAWDLSNRLIMAPLTRCRASEGRVPNEMMAEYYRQRAGAGLILTEATSISPMGVGYPDTPGIWSQEQVEGWKAVTKAVHEAGGKIILQLWHVGRISDPVYLDGALPVAPSAIAPSGHVSLVRPMKTFETPRALETSEIPGIIEDYRKGAENAKAAGFDGVEIHGANGYLPDQFLQSGSNKRTDEYGGSVENRARFMLEAVDAAISVWGADRVGLHLAPQGDSHDMSDENPADTFGYVAEEAAARGLAFLFTREGQDVAHPIAPGLKKAFTGAIIVNQALDRGSGEALIEKGQADAVSYGRLFIANPDLPARFAEDASLNEPDPSTFYAAGAKGYTDYPALSLNLPDAMKTDHALAHGLARLGLGVNIALHGYTRLPGLHHFAAGLADQFEKTFLPRSLVIGSGYGIAIGEAVFGTLLILGFHLRGALIGGLLLMILLTFGVCLTQNWNVAGLQLPYIAFYAVLLATADKDGFSIDAWRSNHWGGHENFLP